MSSPMFPCPPCSTNVPYPPAPAGTRFESVVCMAHGHLFLAEPSFTQDDGADAVTLRARQDTWLVPNDAEDTAACSTI